MNEVHFSGLASQSNIYGLASLTTADGLNKMLVASRKRKVYCVEYSKNDTTVIPSTREVQFTYIPGRAEIISIDAFNKSAENHDFLVGITFVKLVGETTDEHGKYFNIYSEWEAVGECDLDNIAQGCFSLNLDFMPYQLTHDTVIVEGNKEIVWLLSGGDNKVHVYKEDKAHQCFCEIKSSMFPEFDTIPGTINWMDFYHLREKRLTAFGTQDGYVQISLVSTNVSETKVESSWSLQHDSCISCARLFVDFTQVPVPAFLKSHCGEHRERNIDTGLKPKVHLVVGSALELAVVYMDVLENGLSEQYPLPNSNCFDVVTSVCVADVDMDGINEILVGTYGQELLAYKWIKDEYVFQWNRPFSHPILSVAYMDILGDGVQEILVLSTKGLHVIQHDLEKTAKLCIQRMQSLVKTFSRTNEEDS